MELKKLQYFESVARLSSFTKAAEELHVAQPTITAAIKRIEEELGLPLLVRDKRRVMLTYEGEVFLEKVTEILAKLDDAISDMKYLSEGMDWMMNIGITPIVGASLYSILYNGFSQKHPNVKYKVLELGSYGILKAIDNDEIEMGYLALAEDIGSQYEVYRVQTGEIKVLLNRRNPLSQAAAISIGDLANQNLIHLPHHSYIRRMLDQEFRNHGIQPHILAVPDQMITNYNLVKINAGVSFVLGNAYSSLINVEDVVSIPLKNPIYYNSGFVWKKGKRITKAARLCIKYIQEELEQEE